MASHILLQAQKRLLSLRAQLIDERGNGCLRQLPNPSLDKTQSQIDHTLTNAEARLALYRRRDGVIVPAGSISNPDKSSVPQLPDEVPSVTESEIKSLPRKDTVKHYPTLGVAALEADQASIYRVWLACRYLDDAGQGWVDVELLRQTFASEKAKLRLFGWRRLQQVMWQGNGRFWRWDQQKGRLWLLGAIRVAINLNVDRLQGRPIDLPIKTLTNGVGAFRAHLYGAWHSGRKSSNPISRAKQTELTGIPERTQRQYCNVARIERQRNFAVGTKYKQEDAQEQAWRHGQAFEFLDSYGRIGAENGRYVAWQMPNSYVGPHTQTAKGRMRKINGALKDLVTKGAQGNGGKRVDKLYHADGKEAAKAINKETAVDAFWPTYQSRKKHISLWSAFLKK